MHFQRYYGEKVVYAGGYSGFGVSAVHVSLSPGTGFSARQPWLNDLSYDLGWRVELYPRTAGDVTGNGSADLVGFGLAGVRVHPF